MHKFYISDVFDKEELKKISEETGTEHNAEHVVRLVSEYNACYFPISNVVYEIIQKIFHDDSCTYLNSAPELSLHRTMLDSILGSDKDLSGVVLDLNYESKAIREGVLDFDLTNSLMVVDSQTSKVDSIVDCDFANGIILSLMSGCFLFFTNNLHNYFFGEGTQDDVDACTVDGGEMIKNLPQDDQIKEIALKILKKQSGKGNGSKPNPSKNRNNKKDDEKDDEEN